MARRIIVVVLATLVTLAAAAHAEASSKNSGAKKGHVSLGTITFTKHYDKASPYL